MGPFSAHSHMINYNPIMFCFFLIPNFFHTLANPFKHKQATILSTFHLLQTPPPWYKSAFLSHFMRLKCAVCFFFLCLFVFVFQGALQKCLLTAGDLFKSVELLKSSPWCWSDADRQKVGRLLRCGSLLAGGAVE